MSKKSPHPTWATKFRTKGTELRLLNNTYYLYSVSSKYDPKIKRARKITGKLLGKITKDDGFIESDKNLLRKKVDIRLNKITVKEYGLANYIVNNFTSYIDNLKKYFPHYYKEIIVFAYSRLLKQAPIKNIPLIYDNSFLSTYFKNYKITDKTLSLVLRNLGKNRVNVVNFMKEYLSGSEHILIDGTHIVSNSENIEINLQGYNSDKTYDPQVNLLFMFSSKLSRPAYFRIVPGNVRDVKAFKITLKESGIKDGVIVADKGFYSNTNIDLLDKNKLSYIIPLRRNSSLISYNNISLPNKSGFTSYFSFNKRYIWFYELKHKNKKVIVYFDPSMQSKEEHDYLLRIESIPEEYTFAKFKEKLSSFGTFALYTNIKNQSAKDLYETYKSRNDIEVMFDALKNILKSDITYMQSNDSLQGWIFISYIALSWYYYLYKILKDNNLLKKYSVKDLILNLSYIKKIKINNNWILSEIATKTNDLLTKANIHIT
jgi:transposase